jgi:hypothetical protein
LVGETVVMVVLLLLLLLLLSFLLPLLSWVCMMELLLLLWLVLLLWLLRLLRLLLLLLLLLLSTSQGLKLIQLLHRCLTTLRNLRSSCAKGKVLLDSLLLTSQEAISGRLPLLIDISAPLGPERGMLGGRRKAVDGLCGRELRVIPRIGGIGR